MLHEEEISKWKLFDLIPKTVSSLNSSDIKVEDYQKLLEDLRIRINVLNASVFLLEDKMTSQDLSVINYIAKINKELEEIRKIMMPYPIYIQ